MTCTGLTAFWCPVCGDCTCARGHYGDCCFDSPSCPLHGADSKHAETVELADCEQRISAAAEDLGVKLTEHDHHVVSRFAQYLLDRSRHTTLSPEAIVLRKELGIK